MAPLSSPFFFVQITDASAAPNYSFVEVWLTPAGVVQKVGGRYGDKVLQPGVPVDGSTFAVGDLAQCRSADGMGGLQWELSPVGAGSPPNIYTVRACAYLYNSIPSFTYTPVFPFTGAGDTITANANGALPAVDGVALNVGDTFLYRGQFFGGGAPSQNGIYTVTALGSSTTKWSAIRTPGADTWAALGDALVLVSEGVTNCQTWWFQNNFCPDRLIYGGTHAGNGLTFQYLAPGYQATGQQGSASYPAFSQYAPSAANGNVGPDDTWTLMTPAGGFSDLVLPGPGVYMLSGLIGFNVTITTTNTTEQAYMGARLFDITLGQNVPGTVLASPWVTYDMTGGVGSGVAQGWGQASFANIPYRVTQQTTLNWQGVRHRQSPTLTAWNYVALGGLNAITGIGGGSSYISAVRVG